MMIDRISIHFHNFFSAEFVSHRSIQGNIDKNGLNFDSLGSVSKTSIKIFKNPPPPGDSGVFNISNSPLRDTLLSFIPGAGLQNFGVPKLPNPGVQTLSLGN